MELEFRTFIGSVEHQVGRLPRTINSGITLNTPVGNAIDHYGNIWLADTANNRILIFDNDLKNIIASFGQTGSGLGEFNMPFRLLPHPTENWMYVSDIANTRVQILEYDQGLDIVALKSFGHGDPVNLKGPNGLAFHDGKLCVADEFYEGDEGASRLVIFSEDGEILREIHHVGDDNPQKFLWPQGVDTDSAGNLYIANTGCSNIVRCDWEGNPINFANGSPCIEGIKLARGVAVIDDKVLVPGARDNQIGVYDSNGDLAGYLGGVFAPVQITKGRENSEWLVTEPFLAQLQVHRFNWKDLSKDNLNFAEVDQVIGDERDGEGQFHFVTSAAGQVSGWSKPTNQHPVVDYHQKLLDNVNHQWNLLEKMVPHHLSTWSQMAVTTQLEWMQRWQQSWLRILFQDSPENPKELLWLVDSGNFQMQSADRASEFAAEPNSLPLLPGSLGVCRYQPKHALPGCIAPQLPLLLVTNYLTGIVTIYQYDTLIDELVPYSVFADMGRGKTELHNPQGITVCPLTNDILIADSANNRISRWKLDEFGQGVHLANYGKLGHGKNQFDTPTDLAVDELGNIYVSDQANNRIVKLSSKGKWIQSFGKAGYGVDNDNFFLPTSIEYQDNRLFVSDLVNRAIKIFDTDGQFVTSFNGFGADPSKGQLWMPYLLHVHGDLVFLPDCTLNRINVYQLTSQKQGEVHA